MKSHLNYPDSFFAFDFFIRFPLVSCSLMPFNTFAEALQTAPHRLIHDFSQETWISIDRPKAKSSPYYQFIRWSWQFSNQQRTTNEWRWFWSPGLRELGFGLNSEALQVEVYLSTRSATSVHDSLSMTKYGLVIHFMSSRLVSRRQRALLTSNSRVALISLVPLNRAFRSRWEGDHFRSI